MIIPEVATCRPETEIGILLIITVANSKAKDMTEYGMNGGNQQK